VRIIGTVLLAVVFTVTSCKLALASSVDSLFCDNRFTVTIDAAEYVSLEKASLNRDYFTGWIGLIIERAVLKRYPNVTLSKEWGIGYQIDNSGVTGIHALVPLSSATITLAFPHLKPGPHRLRLGLLDRIGELTEDNAYCFSTPGRFTLTSH
jgi:hypothetical protein